MRSINVALSVCLIGVTVGTPPVRSEIVFRHALDNSPLEVKLRPTEVETDAVKTFHATGTNQYLQQEQALAQGKRLYQTHCQACHLPDGSGRLGPSLIGDKWIRERSATDVGMFEVVYGGASGAMQSFAKRGMSQDDMLKIIAYVRSLKK